MTPDGALWFATEWDGLWRYDARTFRSFTMADGLPSNTVFSILADKEGALWVGTDKGVVRYDGKAFVDWTRQWKELSAEVGDIYQSDDGAIWFATEHGVYRLDGEVLTCVMRDDGPENNRVHTIYQGADGAIWFGTRGNGVWHFDGGNFTHFTEAQELGDNRVLDICQTTDGAMWFATGEGVSRYVPAPPLRASPMPPIQKWGTEVKGDCALRMRKAMDVLSTYALASGTDEWLWVGTKDGGLTRYRRGSMPPSIRIDSVHIDDRPYTGFNAVPKITTGHHLAIFYRALDFKTLKEKQQFQYQFLTADGQTTIDH